MKEKKKSFKKGKETEYLFKFVAASFISVLFLSIFFSYDEKDYKLSGNKDLSELKNPECRRFHDIGISYERGSMRLYIKGEKNYLEKNFQSFQLFRVFVDGPFFSEEFRGPESNGLYFVNDDSNIGLAVHYDITQEGAIDYRIVCIDELFSYGSFNSKNENLEDKRKRSMISKDFDITNFCQTDGKDVIFTYANIKNTSKYTRHNSNTIFTHLDMDQYLNGKPSHTFLYSCALLDAYDQSPLNIIKNVLIGALKSSGRNPDYAINTQEEDSQIKEYVRRITKKNFIYEFSFRQAFFCWKNTTRYKTNYEIEDITKDDIINMKEALFGHQTAVKKVVTNVDQRYLTSLSEYQIINNINNYPTNKKMEIVKDAKLLILEDDEINSALATLMPKESTVIIVKHIDETNDALEFAKKAECKVEIISPNDLESTIQDYID